MRPTVSRLLRSLLIVAALSLATNDSLAAGKQEYKFTNNTNRHATDLHIEFKGSGVTWPGGNPTQTPAGTFNTSNGSGTQVVNLAQGFTGSGVAPGASLVVSFDFAAEKAPLIDKAWWTKGNTINPTINDTLRGPGNTHLLSENPKIRNEWVMAPATGNGIVRAMIDGVPHLFSPLPGDDGEQTAIRFEQFLEATQFGEGSTTGKTSCYASAHLWDGGGLQIIIDQPDATQPMTTGVSPAPGVAPAGLLSLLVVMAGSAVFFLLRRRAAADSSL